MIKSGKPLTVTSCEVSFHRLLSRMVFPFHLLSQKVLLFVCFFSASNCLRPGSITECSLVLSELSLMAPSLCFRNWYSGWTLLLFREMVHVCYLHHNGGPMSWEPLFFSRKGTWTWMFWIQFPLGRRSCGMKQKLLEGRGLSWLVAATPLW